MATSTKQNGWVVGDWHQAANTTNRSGRRSQHVSALKRYSSEVRSDISISHQLDNRRYKSSACRISNVDFVQDDTFKHNHPNVGGLCGVMSSTPTWGLPGLIRKAFQPLFYCRDDNMTAQTTRSSVTLDSTTDSFHDGSTTKCSNATIKLQQTSSGSAMVYWSSFSDEYSSTHSTDCSTDSESEKLREQNRRWRRGF